MQGHDLDMIGSLPNQVILLFYDFILSEQTPVHIFGKKSEL